MDNQVNPGQLYCYEYTLETSAALRLMSKLLKNHVAEELLAPCQSLSLEDQLTLHVVTEIDLFPKQAGGRGG